MKNIVFIAPPGAGKGTLSEILEKKYNMLHISTGDMLREEVQKQTSLGTSIKESMEAGLLISDEIITSILKNKLQSEDIGNGFILDGYPRSIKQTKLLDNMLKELNLSIDHVIYIDMDYELVKKRILGRLTCPKCNRGYNKYSIDMKPKQDNICDDCNETLIGRSDDNEETLKIRFNEYINNISPIIAYYEKLNILKRIDNKGSINDTFKQVESVIK